MQYPPPSINPPKSALTAAFTLIEISIVLVIIGLVVGGVLVGRDLIRASELRAVISEVEKIRTATNTFRTKYNCLPGDCANATDFFGTTGANGTTISNGNGDGLIGVFQTSETEAWQYWDQLALAGLWPGSFTGANGTTPGGCGAGNRTAAPGVNVPLAKTGYGSGIYGGIGGGTGPAGYMVVNWGGNTTGDWSPAVLANFNQNVILLGSIINVACEPIGVAFTPADAFSIDTKADDGKPGTGSWVLPGVSGADYDYVCEGGNNNPATATYNITYGGYVPYATGLPSCSFVIKAGF